MPEWGFYLTKSTRWGRVEVSQGGEKMFELEKTLKTTIVVYLVGMAFSFEAMIWGKDSLQSTIAGMAVWFACLYAFYVVGVFVKRRKEFLLLMGGMTAFVGLVFVFSFFFDEVRAIAFFADLICWPICFPFVYMAELICEEEANLMILLAARIIPYLCIILMCILGMKEGERT